MVTSIFNHLAPIASLLIAKAVLRDGFPYEVSPLREFPQELPSSVPFAF